MGLAYIYHYCGKHDGIPADIMPEIELKVLHLDLLTAGREIRQLELAGASGFELQNPHTII